MTSMLARDLSSLSFISTVTVNFIRWSLCGFVFTHAQTPKQLLQKNFATKNYVGYSLLARDEESEHSTLGIRA